jgi:hypothetical protein
MAPGEMPCFINDLERPAARIVRIAERSERHDPGTAPVDLFPATLNRSAA